MAKRKRNYKVYDDWLWLDCWYIWRVDNHTDVVCYEWKVIEDLGKEVKCKMVDKNIHKSNDLFEIILPKKSVTVT